MSVRNKIAAILAAAVLVLASATSASAHDVVCTTSIGTPYKISGTAVRTDGRVSCNYSPDIANTTVQLEILVSGSWNNFGTPYTSSSTGVNLYPYDSAGLSAGCNFYRGRIHREAFHGTWGTTTKYSSSAYICR